MGFDILTAVVMNNSVVWDITPCSPLKVNRRFGRTCRLHLPLTATCFHVGFLLDLFFDPADVPPKRR
jgi:hypothetical protein